MDLAKQVFFKLLLEICFMSVILKFNNTEVQKALRKSSRTRSKSKISRKILLKVLRTSKKSQFK